MHAANSLELMHNTNTPKLTRSLKLSFGSFKHAGVIRRATVGNTAQFVSCLLSKLIQSSLIKPSFAQGCCHLIQFTAAPSSIDYCSRRFRSNRFVLAPRAAVGDEVAPEQYHQVIYPHVPFRFHKNDNLSILVWHIKYGSNTLLTSCFWTPPEIDDIHCLIRRGTRLARQFISYRIQILRYMFVLYRAGYEAGTCPKVF